MMERDKMEVENCAHSTEWIYFLPNAILFQQSGDGSFSIRPPDTIKVSARCTACRLMWCLNSRSLTARLNLLHGSFANYYNVRNRFIYMRLGGPWCRGGAFLRRSELKPCAWGTGRTETEPRNCWNSFAYQRSRSRMHTNSGLTERYTSGGAARLARMRLSTVGLERDAAWVHIHLDLPFEQMLVSKSTHFAEMKKIWKEIKVLFPQGVPRWLRRWSVTHRSSPN